MIWRVMAVDTVVEILHPLPHPLTQMDVNPGIELPGIITIRYHFLWQYHSGVATASSAKWKKNINCPCKQGLP